MIFYLGCALILGGVFMLVRYIYHGTWPKVEGVIEEVIKEEKNWWSRKSGKIVTVTYYYNSERFEKKRTYLIADDAEQGQTVMLSLHPKNPKDFQPVSHKLELFWALFLVVAGAGVIWGCIAILNTFDAW